MLRRNSNAAKRPERLHGFTGAAPSMPDGSNQAIFVFADFELSITIEQASSVW